MKKIFNYLRSDLSFLAISAFWLVALLNPVFKKFDYGAGLPLVLIFSVLIAFLAIRELRSKRERSLIEVTSLLLFVIFVGVSFLFSQTRNIGFPEVLAFFAVSAFYLVYAHQRLDFRGKFLKVAAVGGFLAVLMGFGLYIFEDQTRMIGPFFNIFYHANEWPNAFALFLVMIWPIFLNYRWGRWLLPLVLAALLLTFSRGALIVLGGQLVLLAIYYVRRINAKAAAAVLLTAIVSVGIFWGTNALRALNHPVIDVQERIAFENNESLTSKQERMDFWLGAIDLIQEKPLLGWGPFSFRYGYNGIQETFLGNADHPHNIFLKIGAENGLIALGGFALFVLAWLLTAGKRIWHLARPERDEVYLIWVAVAGAFAHNLIDYNFNFFANLLLLFIFMALIRSAVVRKADTQYGGFVGAFLALFVAVWAIYDGGALALSYQNSKSDLEFRSNYARDYYLDAADARLVADDYDQAIELATRHIELNPLEAQAHYLRGVAYCKREYDRYSLETCRENFGEALRLNPMNDFNYYRDYLRVLYVQGDREEIDRVLSELMPVLEIYFLYIRDNVHFTAFTHNLHSFGDLVDMLAEKGEFDDPADWVRRKDAILQYAEDHHGSSFFMVK